MKSFEIKLDLDFYPVVTERDISLNWQKTYHDALPVEQEVSLKYIVGGESYSYYPGFLSTAINDLGSEYSLMESRSSHTVVISGYPLMGATFDNDDKVIFTRHDGTVITQPISLYEILDTIASSIHLLNAYTREKNRST
ncbi:hypothetical protein [Brevundimonas sp.]